jgi:hypothetical protein
MRYARPLALWTLLAGIVLTIVLAPSALQAQQGPPGQAPASGYGSVSRSGTIPPRDLALASNSTKGGASGVWLLLVLLLLFLLVVGGVAYARSRRT